MWIAGLPAFCRPDRRAVLPSMAITPSGAPVSAAPQATKQLWNCPSSRTARMSPDGRVQACRPCRSEPAQKLALCAAEQGDIDDALGSGQHGKQAQEEDFVERVGYLALLVRILQVFEIAQKNDRLVKRGTIGRWIFHGCPRISEFRGVIDSAPYRFVTYSFTRLL